jgi:prepilin-type N-terminal cleavage/methylation domain-containing protein
MTHSAHPIFDTPECVEKACVLPTPYGLSFQPKHTRTNGFSLVELLVVLAIVTILSSMLLLSTSGTKSSRDLANAAYSIQGALEQARTFAMASNTYTWVGFFEENAASPGNAGVGQVVISIIASANGMNLDTVGSPIATLPYTYSSQPNLPLMTQVSKLLKIPNVHLTVIPSASVTRPAIAVTTPADLYQVGSPDFPNTTTFFYPLSSSSSAAQYTFKQIIQFSPQGDATRIADYPTQFMEVGLQPSHGNTIGTTGTNFAVIQVSGIGGQVITYRP